MFALYEDIFSMLMISRQAVKVHSENLKMTGYKKEHLVI